MGDGIIRQTSDPSELTTLALQREISSLKELLLSHVARIDKSIEVAHENLVRVPTDVQKAVGNLKELHEERFISVHDKFKEAGELRDEKFEGVEKQFKERDVRSEQSSVSSKVAVDAALQAAKELVIQQNVSIAQANSKQEASFTKQIDQQSLLIMTTNKAVDDKINDLKERFAKIDGQGLGKKDSGTQVGVVIGYIFGAIGLIATIISVIILISKQMNGG